MLTIIPNENSLTYRICDEVGVLVEMTQEQATILRMAITQGYEPAIGFNLVFKGRKLLIALDDSTKRILIEAKEKAAKKAFRFNVSL